MSGRCLRGDTWPKGPSIHQTDSSAPRPAPIISVVNTRPESSGWQCLNRTAPKRQNRTSWQLPGFDTRGLEDAYLIVSLEHLVEVSKRLPVCVCTELLGLIIAARGENWAHSVHHGQSGLRREPLRERDTEIAIHNT